MKTFAEAFESCIPQSPVNVDEETKQALTKRALDIHATIRDLYAELEDHPALSTFLSAVDSECDSKHDARMNVFMIGLRIGMAMERSETGGVVIE